MCVKLNTTKKIRKIFPSSL